MGWCYPSLSSSIAAMKSAGKKDEPEEPVTKKDEDSDEESDENEKEREDIDVRDVRYKLETLGSFIIIIFVTWTVV